MTLGQRLNHLTGAYFSEFQCCSLLLWKSPSREWTITLSSGWWLRNFETFWYSYAFKASVTTEKIIPFWAKSQSKKMSISTMSVLLAAEDTPVLQRCIIWAMGKSCNIRSPLCDPHDYLWVTLAVHNSSFFSGTSLSFCILLIF